MNRLFHPAAVAILLVLATGKAGAVVNLKISPNSTVRLAGEVEANYTTTHLFIDEVAGDSIPITVFFEFNPGASNIESVEVFTNLNRRDRADDDANLDGVEDGILPVPGSLVAPGSDDHYFKSHVMTPVGTPGTGYQIVLNANRTGAYRLSARFRFNGDPAGQYFYYNDTDGGGKRDHAIVVSPKAARDVRLYEVNTLNIEASGTLFSQRSTFEDLSDRPNAIHQSPGRANQWNLQYVKNLGINWLWFQPYHPYGWEGRHLSAQNIKDRDPSQQSATTWLWNAGSPSEDVNYPYALGSPYAVKNFWEVEPRMSASFVGDPSNPSDVSSQNNRDNAMTSFRNFVADADTEGVNIMPDAAFNHTAWDVELGEPGIETSGGNPNISWMAAQGASGWTKTDLVHDRELRVFSREGDYRLRANSYTDFFNNNIAPGPDRSDFGKWLDVCDIFFGRYSALVGAQDGSETGNFNNQGDWLDYSPGNWNGSSGGSFDEFTRATWRYFARYAPYWLEKTRPAGQNRNSLPTDGDTAFRRTWDARGIDGLRCDFGQGLPPQAWEYIINVARSHKWSFVFMAETLDDGAPASRSNRQFDILNETAFRSLRSAATAQAYRTLFDLKRDTFGQGLVLLNTVSHDEDNFVDPWDAVTRFSVSSTQDGVPMIFPGQELGIETQYGYDIMEKNFGKYIPHFKTYNSMMPLWTNTNYGLDQLSHVYSAINAARGFSPALRSSNRYFLNGNSGNPKIFATAKYEEPSASPALKDAVLAFANLDIGNLQEDTFVIPGDLANLLGIKDERIYNVRNIAAYTAQQSNRRDIYLWGAGITGAALKSTGFFVRLYRVPVANSDWIAEPYEAQYLKLYDVTPPPAPAAPDSSNPQAYVIANDASFSWAPAADPDGGISGYRFQLGSSPGASNLYEGTVNTTSLTIGGLSHGSIVYARVSQINLAGVEGPFSQPSVQISVLDGSLDEDGDGQSNASEQIAGTSPFDPSSVFTIQSIEIVGVDVHIHISSVPGKEYRLLSNTQLSDNWLPVGGPVSANGPVTTLIHHSGAGHTRRFYRAAISE
jgi:hypothetical protein